MDTQPVNVATKPRLSRLAVISLFFGIFPYFFFVLWILLGGFPVFLSHTVSIALYVFFFASLPVAVLTGMIAEREIKKSPNVRGKKLASVAIGLAGVALFLLVLLLFLPMK